jgi:hypothetical protein
MRRQTVTVTWMDGQQDMFTTGGQLGENATGTILFISSTEYERDLPGGEQQRIPLGNVRIYKIEAD